MWSLILQMRECYTDPNSLPSVSLFHFIIITQNKNIFQICIELEHFQIFATFLILTLERKPITKFPYPLLLLPFIYTGLKHCSAILIHQIVTFGGYTYLFILFFFTSKTTTSQNFIVRLMLEIFMHLFPLQKLYCFIEKFEFMVSHFWLSLARGFVIISMYFFFFYDPK